MSGDINQRAIGNFRHETLASIKASQGRGGLRCYCDETNTLYIYVESGASLIPDDEFILTTGDLGDTRWVGFAGEFQEGLNNIKILGIEDTFLPPRLASDPITPTEGEIYYNTTTNTFKVYDGSAWETLGTTTDYDQFVLLNGRAGSQVINGGTDAYENLVLSSTSNVSRGEIVFQDDLKHYNNVLIGTGTLTTVGTTLTGVGTSFTTEIVTGTKIYCSGEIVYISSITDDTNAVLKFAPIIDFATEGFTYQNPKFMYEANTADWELYGNLRVYLNGAIPIIGEGNRATGDVSMQLVNRYQPTPIGNLSEFRFGGKNSTGSEVWYGKIINYVDDNTLGAEIGGLKFQTMTAGANVDVLDLEPDGTISALTASYETLVTADNDIPNKKYVDDAIANIQVNQRIFTVTSAFASLEVITLTTGNGSISGTSTPVGDTIALDIDAPTFTANGKIQIYVDGVLQVKGTDVIWDSTNTFHFNGVLSIGAIFSIIQMV